ncbi:uncharacterized protein LOC129807160 [Phlebotomus papatasi]|uniref:uncharacterized protein LOC129807160 n=1 Tax=Phlebotomus papatasi TaxID=29031 RepID=UPI002483D6DE|nr:uncharacterized protein LOC129807160 [Phlebotomus papatasi]
MKKSFDQMCAKQGRVNVQLNLLNKYIHGTKHYFPLKSMEELTELEDKIENPGIKAAVETELLRMVKKGDDNFLSKIATPDLIAQFNVTGRGSRINLLDYHIFKYSSEIMQLNRKQLRVHVERQQSIIRSRQRRAAQKTTSIPTLEVAQEVVQEVVEEVVLEPVPAAPALPIANTTLYEFPAAIIPPSSFSNV